MFSRLDTVILRVRDLADAQRWYADRLGLAPVFLAPAQRLAVLGLEGATSLTLWELPAGTPASPSSTFPIFAVADARGAQARLAAAGVAVDALVDAPGGRYFSFADLDGNRLEACAVLAEGG